MPANGKKATTARASTDGLGRMTGRSLCRGGLNIDLEQHRNLGRKNLMQRSIQVLTAPDSDAFHAVTLSQGAKIEAPQLHARQDADVEVRAEFFERTVTEVIDDDESDGQAELRGRPEALDRIHRRPVAQEADDFPSRPRQRHAHR